MKNKRKILLIANRLEDFNNGKQIIENLGYICLTSTNSIKVLDLVSLERPDIVITDLNMPKKDGLVILKELKKFDSNIVVIILAANGTLSSAIKALKFGAFDYLQKPISREQLEAAIHRAMDFKLLSVRKNLFIFEKLEAAIRKVMSYKQHSDDVNLRSQIIEKQRLDNMIGKSNIMKELFEEVIKISKTDANVMIYGESGTGKELIARSIHVNSSRRTNAFIAVDCVALPESLLESELFGYEKGAFTGAESMRKGLLEYADQGTLFLDEICELVHNIQAKLLRVLQEREFRRIGGNRLIKIDIRIISATNKEPIEAVQTGLLRADLYYRLNVIPLELPPLRTRKEDIPLLVNYYLDKFDNLTKSGRKIIDPSVMDAMLNYSWPGNVRELQNLVERLVSLIEGPRILLSDLPKYITNLARHDSVKRAQRSNPPFLESRKKFLQEFEKGYFANLLKKCNGNISKASNIAQISRRTMYRMINNYNLHN